MHAKPLQPPAAFNVQYAPEVLNKFRESLLHQLSNQPASDVHANDVQEVRCSDLLLTR
jgi:hypothetical protein